MKIIKLSLLTSLCLASVFARASNEVSELDYYQDLPVVLSASRLSQPLSEAPNAMTVIDRKMIIASGFRTIPDLFKLVPGMYVSYYKGSQAFVSYHGSTDQYARRMQVMIDGRSVYMPPVSTVDWADLPITVDDIERIEVIRGPAAASHGANSTQGVISITTRDAGAVDGRSVSFTHGSKGINDVTARFGKHGENWNYRVTLAHNSDDGYDDLTSPPNGMSLSAPRAPTLLHNGFDSNQARLLNIRSDYHPNGNDSFDLQLGLSHDTQGVGFTDKNPSALNPSSTNWNTPHDLVSDSGFVQLGWLRALDAGAELKILYYHIRQDQGESFHYYYNGAASTTPLSQSITAIRDEVEIQHQLTTSQFNRLVYGAAWRSDSVDAQQYVIERALYGVAPTYSSTSKTQEYRLFAHDEWRLSQAMMLNIGGMFEKDGFGNENTSPRIALNVRISPQHSLRIGSSVAYRTPALVESQFPEVKPGIPYQPGAIFVPSSSINSPGLSPERMFSKEIGYIAELSEWRTNLDLRVFSDVVSDGIFVSPSKKFVNGLKFNWEGFEASLKHNLDLDSDVTVNFARMRGNSNAPALVASGNTQLSPADSTISDIFTGSLPNNSASALYSHRMADGFSYSASYYYQDALQPFDRGSVDHQPVQRRMDVRLAQTFGGHGDVRGEVSLVIQNLFDQGYTEYVANNVFDRRGYLTLKLDW